MTFATPAKPIPSLSAHSSEVGIPPDPPWPGEQDATKIDAIHPPPKKLSQNNVLANNKQTIPGKNISNSSNIITPSKNRSDSTNYNKSKTRTPR
jgi:hypothetical protein